VVDCPSYCMVKSMTEDAVKDGTRGDPSSADFKSLVIFFQAYGPTSAIYVALEFSHFPQIIRYHTHRYVGSISAQDCL